MTRKFREFRKSLGQEKARVKLYKSGKEWVKAGIKEIQLLKAMGLPFLSRDIVKNEDGEVTTRFGEKIKKHAMQTTAIAGGMFTVNMLHDQQAFAASDAPMTSELATKSQTIGDQTSIAIENSVSNVEASASTVESDSVVTSESEVLKQDIESTSLSESDSVSLSESASTSTSTSVSQVSKHKQSDEKQVSNSEKQSESNVEKSTSVSKASETSEAITSKSEGKTSASINQNSQNSMQPASVSVSEKQSSSQASSQSLANTEALVLNSTISPVHTVATEVGETAFRVALSSRSERDRNQGKGRDTRNNVIVYYELQVDSDGYNAIFKYTVSYDNYRTAGIDSPSSLYYPRTKVRNTSDKNIGMLKLGKDYGKPTKITQGITERGWRTRFASTDQTYPLRGDAKNGYYWQSGVMDSEQIKAGYGLTTVIEVPILNPNGDVSYNFTPFASYDDIGGKRGQNYFSDVVSNVDPYKKYNPNGARAITESRNASTSLVKAQSESVVRSQSVAESERISASKSTSIKNSEAKSHSIAESERISASKSTSIKNSEAKSHSIAESERISASKSTSIKNSEAKSHSIAESERISAS
ncbi:KxYKxGKxW signal peptide domain-containing protein, partial [Staphylococcus coagulans]|uniref:KxYKxGKxW signal peptide domain-containing protein n=1 Tax=Staphylococcus coagulans TaxID=74706 RepID=UPI003981668E